MENDLLIVCALIAFAVLSSGIIFYKKRKGVVSKQEVVPPEPRIKEVAGLKNKLLKTRGVFGSLFSTTKENGLSNAEWEKVEEAMIEADVGVKTANFLIDSVKNKVAINGELRNIRADLKIAAESLLTKNGFGELAVEGKPRPYVISVVGVNGVGKTTTTGKLSLYFSKKGVTVLLGAVDTFRAGAIAQLKVWADRSQAQFVTGREGADPGAVAFDSVTAAKARNIDLVLLDTAGRLHTKLNLMEELKKIHKVVKKVIPEAPHETWLVIDGTLGQNSIQQAREFQKTLEITGVIITKLDGTAKGGAVLAIANELGLPIRFIGVGEAVEDLVPFAPKLFVEAILD